MAKHLMWEFEKIKKWEDHLADAITDFCGKMSFVYIHITWFGVWIVVNIGLLAFVTRFDPFPFGLLTLIVSLEAIFLSTFVMISQNRSARQADLRAQLDYETDVKAEQEIEQIMTMLKEIHEALGLSTKGTTPIEEHTTKFDQTSFARLELEQKMGEAAAQPLGRFGPSDDESH